MSKKPGIYYIIMFDWPEEVTDELSKKVRRFHQLVENATWIKEIVAASGGIGIGATSIWIFWLQDYTELDKLLRSEEEISTLYHEWTKEMQNVETMVREEVIFV